MTSGRPIYTQIAPATNAAWFVRDVTVAVPDTLTLSAQDAPLPNADIVWHGEVAGDRDHGRQSRRDRRPYRRGGPELAGPGH